MKIYSQAEHAGGSLNYEQFSFNPSYLQAQPLTGSQLAHNGKKFSFRSEMRKASGEKERLFKNSSHIYVTSESEEKARKRASKSPVSRRKIFDERIRVTNLYERTSLDHKEQQQPPFRQEQHLPASKEEKSNARADRI